MYSSSLQVIDGIEPGQYCDYAVADYGGAAGPGTGMTALHSYINREPA